LAVVVLERGVLPDMSIRENTTTEDAQDQEGKCFIEKRKITVFQTASVNSQ
jgi:hypothetical protein